MIKQIETTHKGLGIPIVFHDIAVLGQTSVLDLGEKGVGKGTTVRSTKGINIKPQLDMMMDSLNMTVLSNRIKGVSNENLLWRIKEWSTFSPYHRNYFLTVGSQIISDHSYEHVMQSKVGKPILLKVDNCMLMCLIGITPLKFQRMYTENENWESLASDRFIKWVTINPLRKESVKFDPKHDLPDIDLKLKRLPIESTLMITKKVLQKQITEERLPIFVRDLINAYCIMENYEQVNVKAELEFMKLFGIYLSIFPSITYTTNIEMPDSIAIGSLRLLAIVARHEGITIDDLIQVFNVYHKENRSERYDETIMRHTQILQDRDLMQIQTESPKRFYMSKRLENYFDWYRSIVS